jgi:hypothetical protein
MVVRNSVEATKSVNMIVHVRETVIAESSPSSSCDPPPRPGIPARCSLKAYVECRSRHP